jgi:chlorobactene glucosyltransferase
MTGETTTNAGLVSVLIPARDEELNLRACLDRVLSQGDVVFEILVYDDHSTDDTPRIVEEYALHDRRLRLVSTKPLPKQWYGKNFACAQLATEARGRWLLFLDADARLNTGALRHALTKAEELRVSLLSCWPRLELAGFWEKVLMPMLNFVVFTLYPAPLALKRNDTSLGLAHGSFILVLRDAYFRIGGHKLVHAEIFEDVRLAQAWREHGERSLCLDGQDVLSVRMYRSFVEIWQGFRKNFFPAFKTTSSFWMFITFHTFVILLPFLLLPLVVRVHAAWPIVLCVLSVLSMRFLLALRFRHPVWSLLLHPISEFVLIALGIASWWTCKIGHGVEWKGRRYRSFEFVQKGDGKRSGLSLHLSENETQSLANNTDENQFRKT